MEEPLPHLAVVRPKEGAQRSVAYDSSVGDAQQMLAVVLMAGHAHVYSLPLVFPGSLFLPVGYSQGFSSYFIG